MDELINCNYRKSKFNIDSHSKFDSMNQYVMDHEILNISGENVFFLKNHNQIQSKDFKSSQLKHIFIFCRIVVFTQFSMFFFHKYIFLKSLLELVLV